MSAERTGGGIGEPAPRTDFHTISLSARSGARSGSSRFIAADASALYARNVLDFVKLIADKEGKLAINMEDEIVAACLMTRGGEVLKKA